MNHGDLFWVDFPRRGGREQAGLRPAIIWQDTLAYLTPTLIVIPVTSSLNALKIPGTYRLRPTPLNGLTIESVALVFQIAATDRSRFANKIGHLDDPDLLAIADLARKLQRL